MLGRQHTKAWDISNNHSIALEKGQKLTCPPRHHVSIIGNLIEAGAVKHLWLPQSHECRLFPFEPKQKLSRFFSPVGYQLTYCLCISTESQLCCLYSTRSNILFFLDWESKRSITPCFAAIWPASEQMNEGLSSFQHLLYPHYNS